MHRRTIDLDIAIPWTAHRGQRNGLTPREVGSRIAWCFLRYFGGRASIDDLTAIAPCIGTDVDDVVGSTHHLLIMLDDDNSVAQVSQTVNDTDEALGITLVQTDTRFVQDVERAYEATSELRREGHSLALPTGEGAGESVKGQITQADLIEEGQARADLMK